MIESIYLLIKGYIPVTFARIPRMIYGIYIFLIKGYWKVLVLGEKS